MFITNTTVEVYNLEITTQSSIPMKRPNIKLIVICAKLNEEYIRYINIVVDKGDN